MKDSIKNAIRDQKCLEFYYEGHPRLVEPHCFGISTRGNYVQRAYQFGGTGSSAVPSWKLFDVDKIEKLIILDEYFAGTRPGYRRGDKNMTRIIAEL